MATGRHVDQNQQFHTHESEKHPRAMAHADAEPKLIQGMPTADGMRVFGRCGQIPVRQTAKPEQAR